MGGGIAVYRRIEQKDDERLLEALALAGKMRDYSNTFAVNHMMSNSPTAILMTSVKTNSLQSCYNVSTSVALHANSSPVNSQEDKAEIDYT